QRIQLEEVTMRSRRRAWAAVAGLLPGVGAVDGATRKRIARGLILCERRAAEVPRQPVHIRASGRIGIIHDQGVTLRALWPGGPLKRRRDVLALTRVFRRDVAFVLERGTG